MKTLYCSKCGVTVIEVQKGKVKPNLYIECKKCQNKRYDGMPDGFGEIFGGME